MTHPSSTGISTNVSQVINAPRSNVYRAFLDPHAIATWLPPDSMRGEVHEFDPRPGGALQMSLIYETEQHPVSGKTSADIDRFRGTFAELIPDAKIVWAVQFDSPDPQFSGEMSVSFLLADTHEGTCVTVVCDNIPQGIRPEDNEAGCRSTLRKLKKYVE